MKRLYELCNEIFFIGGICNINKTKFPGKSIEDIVYLVNGAKHFLKLGLIKAFHQLTMNEESRYITTITTPPGLMRFKRLHMRVSYASEIFSEHIKVLLET